MSNNRLVLNGLDDLREALRNLPDELAAEARGIVMAAGERAAAEARAGYAAHRHSGELADGLKIEVLALGSFGVGVNVVNTAFLAWIFENGSELRHYYTKKKHVLHATGKMPAGNVFVPAMVRHRDPMWDALRALVESKGLTVRDAG